MNDDYVKYTIYCASQCAVSCEKSPDFRDQFIIWVEETVGHYGKTDCFTRFYGFLIERFQWIVVGVLQKIERAYQVPKCLNLGFLRVFDVDVIWSAQAR